MIKAILIFNNHGKPRLSKFYERYVSIQSNAGRVSGRPAPPLLLTEATVGLRLPRAARQSTDPPGRAPPGTGLAVACGRPPARCSLTRPLACICRAPPVTTLTRAQGSRVAQGGSWLAAVGCRAPPLAPLTRGHEHRVRASDHSSNEKCPGWRSTTSMEQQSNRYSYYELLVNSQNVCVFFSRVSVHGVEADLGSFGFTTHGILY